MKEVTIRIPDHKYQFFMELMQSLGFEKTDELHIPEAHKSIVRGRIKKSNPDQLVTWQEARERLHNKMAF